MERSVKSCLLFAAVPAFYYLYNKYRICYTDFMYSGTRYSAVIPFSSQYFTLFLYFFTMKKRKNRP